MGHKYERAIQMVAGYTGELACLVRRQVRVSDHQNCNTGFGASVSGVLVTFERGALRGERYFVSDYGSEWGDSVYEVDPSKEAV